MSREAQTELTAPHLDRKILVKFGDLKAEQPARNDTLTGCFVGVERSHQGID